MIRMPRIIVTLTDKQLHDLNMLVRRGIYQNRSEAIRDSIRKLVLEVEERSMKRGLRHETE